MELRSKLIGIICAVITATIALSACVMPGGESPSPWTGYDPYRQFTPMPLDSFAWPQPEIPTPPEPETYIGRRIAGGILDTNGTQSFTASCLPGEQLMGGGYANASGMGTGGLINSVNVRANYPSSANSWTATFRQGNATANTTVLVFAYCLAAPNYPIDIVQVAADDPGTGPRAVASCPAGSVLTGGGFRVDGPDHADTDANQNTDVTESRPTFDTQGHAVGWKVSMSPLRPDLGRAYHSYALCSQRGLEALPVADELLDYTNYIVAAADHEATVECPESGLTTGGGTAYVGDNLIPHPVYDSNAKSGFRQWYLRSFSAFQTLNYDFRPCKLSVCVANQLTASCFRTPKIPFIGISIVSPAANGHFDTDPATGKLAYASEVVLAASVVDQSGLQIPGAIVTWQLISAAGTRELGTGAVLKGRFPAGATITPFTLRATATVGSNSRADAIKITTGTVL